MGSQLRKLRAKAGVTGYAHQKRQREAARRKERARFSFQDGNVIVGVGSPGGQLRSSEELRDLLKSAPAAFAGATPGIASELAFHTAKLEEQRLHLAHLLGSHDGAAEIADGIQAAAVARSQASVHPNNEVVEAVWAGALAELRRGVPPTELTVLRNREPALLPQAPERRPPAAGMRMSRVLPLLAFAMIGGMAVPPKEGR